MRVNYEELLALYKAYTRRAAGEWEDAIEDIIYQVPDIVKDHKAMEEELIQLREWMARQKDDKERLHCLAEIVAAMYSNNAVGYPNIMGGPLTTKEAVLAMVDETLKLGS